MADVGQMREWSFASLVAPGSAERRAMIFLDALTGKCQLQCLLGLVESPSRSGRQLLIEEAIAFFINGLEL